MKLFDMHCDTLYECYETDKNLRDNDLAINMNKAKKWSSYAQFFALFCGVRNPDYAPSKGQRKCLLDLPEHERLDAMIAKAKQEFRLNADWLSQCYTAEDITQANAKGKVAAILSIEGAELMHDDDAVQRAYDAGVRLVTLTWNYDSQYACGAKVDNDKGLTKKGLKLIDNLMGRHVIIDVSHLSQAGFWELCAHTDAPFVASHSNSNVICPHIRNLTDLQFDEMIRRGGLVGINIYSEFLTQGKKCTIDDVLLHIEHFCERGGENILALGADLDGCDSMPQGIESVADLDKIANAMLQKNYLQSTVDGIFYNNLSAFVDRML